MIGAWALAGLTGRGFSAEPVAVSAYDGRLKDQTDLEDARAPDGPDTCSADWYFIAEQPAPAPHLAHPEGCAALRIVLVTVPGVSRPC